MNRFNKVGIFWLFFLMMYCTALISIVLFTLQLGVSIIFYFNDGLFLFSWKDALHTALKKGGIAGSLLGGGVWLKNKMYEHQNKK